MTVFRFFRFVNEIKFNLSKQMEKLFSFFFELFFYRRPNIDIGAIRPRIPFNSFQIPLLNTITLITLGVTVT